MLVRERGNSCVWMCFLRAVGELLELDGGGLQTASCFLACLKSQLDWWIVNQLAKEQKHEKKVEVK